MNTTYKVPVLGDILRRTYSTFVSPSISLRETQIIFAYPEGLTKNDFTIIKHPQTKANLAAPIELQHLLVEVIRLEINHKHLNFGYEDGDVDLDNPIVDLHYKLSMISGTLLNDYLTPLGISVNDNRVLDGWEIGKEKQHKSNIVNIK